MSTVRTWPTSTFILPYPQQFNVLPSAARTPADFHFQKRHKALLTNVCEHPESINTVHSCPSTYSFMEGSFLVSSRSGRRLRLMPPPLWHYPGTAILYVQGHCIWSNVSHDEPCASNYSASLGDSVSCPSPCGWDHHTCSKQIFYCHCTPLILKVFIWRRRWPILWGLRCQSWKLSFGLIVVLHSSFSSWMRHVIVV